MLKPRAISLSAAREQTAYYERFGFARAHHDLDSLLRDPAVDGVYLALPNSMHHAAVQAAARAKKHILCEKPFAMNVAHAREMVRKIEAARMAAADDRFVLIARTDAIEPLEHRREVVVRRTAFELRKAEERAHILEGLKIALDHLDKLIYACDPSEFRSLAAEFQKRWRALCVLTFMGISEPVRDSPPISRAPPRPAMKIRYGRYHVREAVLARGTSSSAVVD